MAKSKHPFVSLVSFVILVFVFFVAFRGCDDSEPSSSRSYSSDRTTTSTTTTSQPPAVTTYAEIIAWNWRKDPSFGTDGTIKWNVQVKNSSNLYFDNVRIEFTTYDASDRLVSSTFSYVDAIPPGGTRSESSFADLYGTEQRATIQVTRVSTSTYDQWNLDAAEISDWNWRKDASFGTDGTIHWTVQIRNTSGRYIESVRVEFTTYDSSGKLVSTTFTYVDAIAPGGTRSESSYADYYRTEEKAATVITNVRFSN